MTTTTLHTYLVRDQPIQRLERVVDALAEAAKHSGEPREPLLAALRAALSAECDRCGARVTGEELLILSQWPDTRESIRIKRLRCGHCVRVECASHDYRLVFQNHPDLNWPRLFSSRPPETPVPDAELESNAATDLAAPSAGRRMAVRIGVLVGAIVLLFILHQLHNGGRIPLLREPEEFRVDPAPHGEAKLGFK